MATSTRRTFTQGYEGPTVDESVKLSQSAQQRALATQAQGIEGDRKRQQQQAQAAQATAFYRGGGDYSTLGADGGYRPRGTVTSGGVATGARVPSNNGLMSGMPAPAGGDDSALLSTTERLAEVALERGPLIGTARPTPNLVDASNIATDVFPRYPQDRYFQSTTKQTWQWVGADGEDAGYWDVAAPNDLLPVGIESPAVEHYPGLDNGAIRYRVEGFTVSSLETDGTTGTAGTVDVIVDGVTATAGVTLLQPTGRLSISVTEAGTGRMIVTIELRPI